MLRSGGSVGVVQTFLPFEDFEESARVLDQKRLGKQRVETIQVVRALVVPDYGWRHHPAALMWRGSLEALGAYGVAIVQEWLRRGFADTCEATIRADLERAGVTVVRTQAELAAEGLVPHWLGDDAFHLSHRSSLLRKDPEHYAAMFPSTPDDLPYVWPKPDGT